LIDRDARVTFFRKRLGQEGEVIAEKFLKKKGYKLVQRNYRCKTGEVDLIALDGKVIVFVEVKTRTDHRFGSPFEAVETHKQRKMIQAAQFFLHERKLEQRDARFDVVGVSWPTGRPVIEHIENAFEVT
jgi:putative endonuclease